MNKLLSAFCVLAPFLLNGADFGFVREVTVSAELAPRARGEKTGCRFIIERQPYLPFDNFLNYYTDRPLFEDVSLRECPLPARAAFEREIEILKDCGFDGFGSIHYPTIYLDQMRWLTEKPVQGYSQMLIVASSLGESPKRGTTAYESVKERILAAARCPSAERMDGRPVVWAYQGGTDRQLQWVKALRADPEVPPFFFFGDIPFGEMYSSKGPQPDRVQDIPVETCERYKDSLARCLEEFDGIKMHVVDCTRKEGEEYGYLRFIDPLYVKYLLPLTKEVLSRPQFRSRRIALYLNQGYVNPFCGPVYEQLGTAQLRAYLDAALMCDADCAVGFEWNEANENTAFQPTVSSGRAVARVCGYYKSILNRAEPFPMPGDNVDVPNLILSVRQTLRLGEPYRVEMLFVPDGTKPLPFRARVVLKDVDGKTLGCLPWESLPVERLTAFTYKIPSETFAGEPAVVPEIEIEANGRIERFTGFDHTRLRTSTEWNYLTSRHCLREMLDPQEFSFSAQRMGNGRFSVSGSLTATEMLASLEIVDSGVEIATADRENEFDRERYDLFRGVCYAMLNNLVKGDGTLDVVGSRGWKLRSAHTAANCFTTQPRAKDGPQGFKITTRDMNATFLLAVPKEDSAKAVLRVDIPDAGTPFELRLADLLSCGRHAHTFEKHMRVELERMDVLGDYAKHVDAKTAKVSACARSANAHPVYQLRAVTKSGRIWRSAPIVPSRADDSCRTQIDVYSETVHKTVPVSIPDGLVTDLSYDFSDTGCGDWLCIREGDRHFDAKLGGAWVYSEPMHASYLGPKHTKAFVSSVPQRVMSEGCSALSFDGSGQYVSLPIETIPHSSPWTLECEFKPDDVENRVLFRMHFLYTVDTAFRLIVEDGVLKVSYVGRDEKPVHFKTGLHPLPGQWNVLKVEKRPDCIACTLNGSIETLPYSLRGGFFQGCLFGANVMPGPGIPDKIAPFKGMLRALRIRHSVGERTKVFPPMHGRLEPWGGWTKGHFQLHAIHTGVAESMFLIYPDGTTMLLDCGDHPAINRGNLAVPVVPNGDRHAGEWIARYVQRVNPAKTVVDYMVTSHFHSDHTGCMTWHAGIKDYLPLSGFSEAAQTLTFAKAVDRGWPLYDEPIPFVDGERMGSRDLMLALYDKLKARDGLVVEKFRLGAADQLAPRKDPSACRDFEVRNVCANGKVVQPDGSVRDLYAAMIARDRPKVLNENGMSLGVLITYGAFKMFLAGDFSDEWTEPDGSTFRTEEALADALTHVQVAKVNHHGYRSMPEKLVRKLMPQVLFSCVWDQLHDGADTMERVGRASRNTCLVAPTVFTNDRRWQDRAASWLPCVSEESREGVHLVFDVPPGGKTYTLTCLDASDEEMRIKSVRKFDSK